MLHIIKNDPNELQTVRRLALDIYDARSNFQELCEALEKLYEHFDAKKDERAA